MSQKFFPEKVSNINIANFELFVKNFNVIVHPKDVTLDKTKENLVIATFNLVMFWRISVRSKNTMR